MQKKHFSLSLLLVLFGISFFTPVPWNHAHSAAQQDSTEKAGKVCTQIRLSSQADSCIAQEIDRLLTEEYGKGAFNGQVLYAEKGNVIYSRCFGYSNVRARKDSIRPENTFQLASLSKPFTAVAVMQLYQEGKIDIYKPVKAYLDDFPFDNITVKDLLQHRSGLKNYIYIADRYWTDKKKPLRNEDISPLLAKYGKTLDFKPGSRFRYCNTNYAYLALLVEKISGQDFARYFDEHIAQPLNMKDTYVYNPANTSESAVDGFSYSRRSGFYKRYPDYLDGVVGDKGLFSTTRDLFRFDQALYSSNFLADSIRELMFTPAVELTENHDNDYGMGFRIKQDSSGHQTVFHNGWWKGFRTYFIHDYQNQKTLIWLNNRSDVTINPYIEKIFEIAGSYYTPQPALAEKNSSEDTLNEQNETYGSEE